jgi:hypothetical protein
MNKLIFCQTSEVNIFWIFVFPQIHILKSSPTMWWYAQVLWGDDSVMRAEESIPFINEATVLCCFVPFTTWEHSWKALSMMEETGSHQTHNLLEPQSWICNLQDCHIFLLFLSHLLYGILEKHPKWMETDKTMTLVKVIT